MRTFLVAMMLLFAVGLSAQRHNFAVITGTDGTDIICRTPVPNR